MNKEFTVKSEKIFEGKIVNLRVDTVELENQKYAKREIVDHKSASAVIAISDKEEIILVKQYRKAVEDYLYEIPAGLMNVSEDPMECAIRELKEETGYETANIKKVYEFYSSPGFTNEKVFLYKAEGLTSGQTKFDEDENIEIMHVTKEQIKQMLDNGSITDSKTIIGILYWLNN